MSLLPRPRASSLVSFGVALLAVLQGCDCGPTDIDSRRFACVEDGECIAGYVCRAGECQPEGGPVDEPDGGPTDGGPDGGPDGGTPDAGPDGGPTDGGPDGGTPDAGPDAGTPDAGPSDAGTPDGGTNTKPTQLLFITPTQRLAAGACSSPVTLEVRDAFGLPSSFPSQTPVGLTVEPAGGLSLFADSGCTTALAEATFAPGASRASFYFKGRSGGSISITAARAGLTSARQTQTILPMVRTGTCQLGENALAVRCTVSPAQLDLSKTMLLFQASSASDSPASVSVRCAFTNEDSIRCVRNSPGGVVRIRWQTAELPVGLKVHHLDASCDNGGAEVLLPTPVRPENTFLLVSSEKGGTTLDRDDFFTAELGGPDYVHLDFSANCAANWRAAVQAVEFTGTSVTRGVTGVMSGTQLVVSDLPPVDPNTTALLFTYRVINSSTPGICDRALRGELTSPTSLTFSRGAGDDSCVDAVIEAISWERIDFGGRGWTQHLFTGMDAETDVDFFPIEAVDPTRTLTFASSQSQCGQAGGEGSYALNDILGAVMGQHWLASPTVLQVSRGIAAGEVGWSTTVVQFEP